MRWFSEQISQNANVSGNDFREDGFCVGTGNTCGISLEILRGDLKNRPLVGLQRPAGFRSFTLSKSSDLWRAARPMSVPVTERFANGQGV